MGIRFKCHHCESNLHVKDTLGGRRGKCPDCGQSIRIPPSDQPFSMRIDEMIGSSVLDDSQAVVEKEAEPAIASTIKSPSSDAVIQPPPIAAASVQPRWLIRPPGGGQYGPAPYPTILEWIEQKRITVDTNVQREGESTWARAIEAIPEAFAPPIYAGIGSKESQIDSKSISGENTQRFGDSVEREPYSLDANASATPAWMRERKRRHRNQQFKLMTILGIMVLVLLALLVWVLFFRQVVPLPTK